MFGISPPAVNGIGVSMFQSEFVRNVNDMIFQTFLLFLRRIRPHCKVNVLGKPIDDLIAFGKAGSAFEYNVRFRFEQVFQEQGHKIIFFRHSRIDTRFLIALYNSLIEKPCVIVQIHFSSLSPKVFPAYMRENISHNEGHLFL